MRSSAAPPRRQSGAPDRRATFLFLSTHYVWWIENLFRILKSVGRLDELRSGKPAVIRAFVAATLVGWALTQLICAAMRTERPRCEPSPYRVFALLLTNLGSLGGAAASGRRMLRERLDAFRDALWREGVNPNPGRPYARERHLATIEK